MKETRFMMGMPITVEIADSAADEKIFAAVFDYFDYIDKTFSTYKPESEIMRINRGELAEKDWSDDMHIIFMLAEQTKQATDGFFDIRRPGGEHGTDSPDAQPFYDPSGIVKGWAIFQAAKLLESRGFKNFYVDAGGDIQTRGMNIASAEGESWSVGIKNPLHKTSSKDGIVKVISVPEKYTKSGLGIATSGTYIRGDHIYNPHYSKKSGDGEKSPSTIVSLTVIGPNIYEADRFATAAFAMGSLGIHFIEQLPNFEGYMIDQNGVATMTTHFHVYLHR